MQITNASTTLSSSATQQHNGTTTTANNNDNGDSSNSSSNNSGGSGSNNNNNNNKAISQQGNGSIQNTNNEQEMLGRVNKQELIRLILQSLNDLGYQNAAKTLEQDSGIALESDTVTRFRTAILAGDWSLAESLLTMLPGSDNPATMNIGQALFLIRQQKFLELLEAQKTMKALHVLRNELTPLGQSIDRLHHLSSLIFCSSVQDIRAQAQWDGVDGSSRQQLLVDLQEYIPPSTMIPKERLLTLINQAFEYQQRHCLYHSNSVAEYSLFENHLCDKTHFPSTTIRVLEGHEDEVWHVAFSHSGRYLSSASKDKTCIIWDLETFEKVQVLSGQDAASYSAWSPDDSKLLVCGTEKNCFYLWDPMSGEKLHTYDEHKDQVTGCVWLPDGEHFISSGCDKCICLWNIDGEIKSRWQTPRTMEMKITKDGKRLVTMTYDRAIEIYNIENFRLNDVGKIEESGTITSLSITQDGRYALTNITETQELHLWDLEERQLIRKYIGQKQKSFVIRSTFGGDDESFIISGSEDNCVYIWSRDYQTLLEVLEGHTGIVNCTSWCPVGPPMFASASDDKTIRIWGVDDGIDKEDAILV
ncbi:wd repeat protein [Lichtheimia corymbifera JMRC:FSU:9682]|uniref:Wd repeat protein n=1 Tax=Lichtheimia corymbifera JMRC:FSU:9682 TaxID=1263082 RepID=A0A068RHM2_9FUNG|nr:wd repeat protein [Lichtheimia corymbifera JMRC:FSU:9682]